jgi:hypothetical protein
MGIVVGIASRAAERTLTGDLDRQRRLLPFNDSSPRLNNF